MKQFKSCPSNQKQHKPTYLIIGQTQSGKSSICQSIYPKSIVQVGENANRQPVTMMPKVFNVKQVNVTLIDTVGFREINNQEIDNIIYKCLKFCVSSNVKQLHGIIIVISIYQNQEQLLLKSISESLLTNFGLKDLNQIFICLTKTNKFQNMEQSQQYFQKIKGICLELKFNPNNIIEFKTNHQIDKQQIVFINQEQQFKKKLLKLSTKIIEIKHSKTKYMEDGFPIHLNVRPKHPGGRHTILQKTQEELFKLEDMQILDELYQICNFKIVQPSKKHCQTKSEKLMKGKLKILKSVILGADQFPELIFRSPNSLTEDDFTLFLSQTGVKKYFILFSEKFKNEIQQEPSERQKSLLKMSFQDSNSILQCLYMQHLIKQDIQQDIKIDLQFNEFLTINKFNINLSEQVESYYNLILGNLSYQDFKKVQAKFHSLNQKLTVQLEDDLIQFEIKNPILPTPKIKSVHVIRQLHPIDLAKQETKTENDQIYIE